MHRVGGPACVYNFDQCHVKEVYYTHGVKGEEEDSRIWDKDDFSDSD